MILVWIALTALSLLVLFSILTREDDYYDEEYYWEEVDFEDE